MLLCFLVIIGPIKRPFNQQLKIKIKFEWRRKKQTNRSVYLKRFAPLVIEHKKEVEDSTL